MVKRGSKPRRRAKLRRRTLLCPPAFRQSLAVAFIACAVLLAGAAPALADSVAIGVTTASGQADPMAFSPRVFTISGTSSTSKRLYIKYRAPDGRSCGTVPISEPGRWLTGFAGDSVVRGAFGFQKVITWDASGPYLFCSWLAASDSSIVAPMTQMIVFRPPSGAIDLVRISPAVPRPDQYFTLTLSGTTEAPARVYAKIRPAGGPPCADRYDDDPGDNLRNGEDVGGPYSTFPSAVEHDPGQYLVCMWLMGAANNPAVIAGPTSRMIEIVEPRPVVSKLAAVDCRTNRAVPKVRVGKVKHVCVRYAFAVEPRNGSKVTIAFMTPAGRRYTSVGLVWVEGSRAVTAKWLRALAYRHRLGRWRVVLRIDGQLIRSASFRVY
jgi:hypothetical protein